MTETVREFELDGRNLISCKQPCGEEFAKPFEGSKIAELGNITATKRCIAAGSALRGQHFGGLGQEDHTKNPAACRICVVYTTTPSVDTAPKPE